MTKPNSFVFSEGFKGLPDGWKQIKPITFITGENSSGKTSFLELIEVLASQAFNLANEIIGSIDEFTDWYDIVSRFGDGKSLTIGFLTQDNSDQIESDAESEDQSISGKLVTFEKKGLRLPAQKVTVISGSNLIQLKTRGRKFLAKTEPISPAEASPEKLSQRFSEVHFDKTKGFETVHESRSKGQIQSSDWFSATVSASLNAFKGKRGKIDMSRALASVNGPPFKVFRYGPIRQETAKFYPSTSTSYFAPTGEHFPYRFREISAGKPTVLDAINQFGSSSGLYDSIRLEKLSGSKNAEAFSIVYSKFGKNFLGSELGYGLGQVIPIATDLLLGKEEATFLIQQPEVHLHPKAQAAFGTLLFNVASSNGAIVVETHSDFIIDRFRVECSKNMATIESQILFFEKPEEAEKPVFHQIGIESDGRLKNAPDSYRAFFINEEIEHFENL